MNKAIIAIIIGEVLLPMIAISDVKPEIRTTVDEAVCRGDYETAFGVLGNQIQLVAKTETNESGPDSEFVEYAISILNDRVAALGRNITKTTITDIPSRAEIVQEDTKRHYDKSRLEGMTVTAWYRLVPLSTQTSKHHDELKKIVIEIPPFPQIQSVLKEYDSLKECLQVWIQIEKHQISSLINVEQHLATKKRLEDIKKRIVEDRTAYLSFVAFSPVLSETARRIHIATGSVIDIDKEKRSRDAVDFLSAHSSREWVKECNQEVRKQFLDLLSQLKEYVGDDRFRDLETRAAVLKSDSDKTVGGQSWWP